MINITNVIKKYDSDVVLNIDELNFQPNEIVGITGTKGAGKTTLLSAILDLVKLDGGIIEINQIPVHHSQEWKEFTNAYLNNKHLIGYMTPFEYFEFIASLKNYTKEETHNFIQTYRTFLDNELEDSQKYIRSLSKENQKKVGILAALIGNPYVVVLDDPFINLDKNAQILLKKIIEDHATNNNTTFLISCQNADLLNELCTRIVTLDKGKIVDDMVTMNRSESFLAV